MSCFFVRVSGCRALQKGFGGALESVACELTHKPYTLVCQVIHQHLRLNPVSSSGTKAVLCTHAVCLTSASFSNLGWRQSYCVLGWRQSHFVLSFSACSGCMYGPIKLQYRCAIARWLCAHSGVVGSVSCHSCMLSDVWCMITLSGQFFW